MFSSSSPDILKPQKAPQQIITKIRRAILAERLVEGDRLPPEPELMRHFGVSRQTIREALCALESMGLLTIKTGLHGGAYVQTVDISIAQAGLSNFLFGKNFSIDNVTEVRLALEPYAARVAAEHMNKCSKRDLRSIVKKTEELVAANGCMDRLQRLEVSFHEMIIGGTENPILMLMYHYSEQLLLNIKTKLNVRSELPHQIVDVHKKILAAIEAGDPDAAEQGMREDILQVERSLVRVADEIDSVNLLDTEAAPAL